MKAEPHKKLAEDLANASERRKLKHLKVPEHTISRLSHYLRCLRQLEEEQVPTISSEELARRFDLNAAQIRKDLAYFGDFGVRGVGYNVGELKDELTEIMGLNRQWRVALFGLGNLGRALMSYKGFSQAGFRVLQVFDSQPGVQEEGSTHGVPIFDPKDAPRLLKEHSIEIAIIAVPAEYAQAIADMVVEAGIVGILTFAPVPLRLPEHIQMRHVDLTVNLENLSFLLHSRE